MSGAIEPNRSQEFLLLWQSLAPTQQRYAIARLSSNSDAAAAKAAGVPVSTARQWRNKADVDEAVRLMSANVIESSTALLTANLNKALLVLVDDLDSKDARLRHDAAESITDRVLGKAVARIAPVMPNGIDPYESSLDRLQEDLIVARIEEFVSRVRERRRAAEAAANITDVTGQYLPGGDGQAGDSQQCD